MSAINRKRNTKKVKQLRDKANSLYMQRVNEPERYVELTAEANLLIAQADKIELDNGRV